MWWNVKQYSLLSGILLTSVLPGAMTSDKFNKALYMLDFGVMNSAFMTTTLQLQQETHALWKTPTQTHSAVFIFHLTRQCFKSDHEPVQCEGDSAPGIAPSVIIANETQDRLMERSVKESRSEACSAVSARVTLCRDAVVLSSFFSPFLLSNSSPLALPPHYEIFGANHTNFI